MIFHQQKSFNFRENRLYNFDLKEIELVFSRECNLKCSFCPHSNERYKFNKGFMDFKILQKLLQDLKNRNIFYEIAGFGEPFLHPEFIKFVKYLDIQLKKTPSSFFTIITNGIIFKKNFKKFYNFFKNLNRLREIKVSCYSKEIFNFFNKKKINWITLKNNFDFSLFNNRAGAIPKFNKNIKYDLCKPYDSCNYSFFFLTIDIDGDVIPCPHDWEKRLIIDNILEKNTLNIWNSKNLNDLRKYFCLNKRQEVYPCNICTAPGTLIGNKVKEDFCLNEN